MKGKFGRVDDDIVLRDSPNVYTIPKYSSRTTIWRYAIGWNREDKIAHEHPAIFTINFARDHIHTWTNPGDLVLDPFAGSGTTLRAAENLGRNSVGIEIHTPYIDLIRRRMEQLVLPLTGD